MTDDGRRAGGCLCAGVRYTAPRTPLAVTTCHCRDCQKQSGAAFSLLAIFPRDAVAIEGTLARFEGVGDSGGAVERYFCARCGSPVYSDTATVRARGLMVVKAGTLDEVDDLAPSAHFWVSSRQPWVPLPAGAVTKERE